MTKPGDVTIAGQRIISGHRGVAGGKRPRSPSVSLPSISNVSEALISPSSVSISWDVSPGSQGQVEYGLTDSYGSTSTLESGYLTYHSQVLSALTESTLYHYRVKAVGPTGLISYSPDGTFTTPAPASSASGLYGPGLNIDSKSNLRVTSVSRGSSVSFRFRASVSSTATSIRFAQRGGSGYSLGTGGTYRVGIQSDDGTGKPSGSWMDYATYSPGNPGGDWEKWDTVSLASPPSLTSGTTYHVVIQNVHASESSNYISVNCAFCFESTTPRFPYYADDIFAVLGNNYPVANGTWQIQAGFLPSVDIAYANGTHDGQAYVNNRRNNYAMIGNAAWARELFTVTGGTRTVSGAWVRCNKQSGTGALTVALKTGAGTAMASGTIAASTFGAWTIDSDTDTGDWGFVAFSPTQTLTDGQQYQLVLTAPAGTQFAMVPITYEYQSGSSFSSRKFDDGIAQDSSNSGGAWGTMGGATLHPNMQFYFTDADIGFDTGYTYSTTNVPTGAGWTDGTDCRAALQSLINGAADGLSTTNHRRFLFPAGYTWVISGNIVLLNRNHITFEGSGTQGAYGHTGGAIIKRTGGYAAGDHLGEFWAVSYYSASAGYRATDIRWHAMTLRGNSTNYSTTTAGSGGEYQHGWSFRSADNCRVAYCITEQNKGDGIYVAAAQSSPGTPSRNIQIDHNIFRQNGRMGVAVVEGEDVTIEDNQFSNICYANVDLEPNSTNALIRNITIQRNLFSDTWSWDSGYTDGCIKIDTPNGIVPLMTGFLRILDNDCTGANYTAGLPFFDARYGDSYFKTATLTVTGNTNVQQKAGPAIRLARWTNGATITGNTGFLSSGSFVSNEGGNGTITQSGNT